MHERGRSAGKGEFETLVTGVPINPRGVGSRFELKYAVPVSMRDRILEQLAQRAKACGHDELGLRCVRQVVGSETLCPISTWSPYERSACFSCVEWV